MHASLVSRPPSEQHIKLVFKVLRALFKVTRYFERHYKQLNVDAITGLQISEGILHHYITNNQNDIAKFPSGTRETLIAESNKLYGIIKSTMTKARTHLSAKRGVVKDNNEKVNIGNYVKMFGPLLRPWYFKATTQAFRRDLVWAKTSPDTLTDKVSDHCMSQMLGTQTSGVQQKCQITDACYNRESATGTQGYTLTHQAFYFILGDALGCHKEIENRVKPMTISSLYALIGSNLYTQMKNNVEKKGLPFVAAADIIMEQSITCSMLGINACHKVKWLEKVLKVQAKIGCILHPRYTPRYTIRKLLYERTLNDGCSSHTTGIFVAYLTDYLQFLTSQYS